MCQRGSKRLDALGGTQRAQISKIREAAIRGGMRSLLEDGKVKILRGDTTPDEVARFAQIEGFNPNEIS